MLWLDLDRPGKKVHGKFKRHTSTRVQSRTTRSFHDDFRVSKPIFTRKLLAKIK